MDKAREISFMHDLEKAIEDFLKGEKDEKIKKFITTRFKDIIKPKNLVLDDFEHKPREVGKFLRSFARSDLKYLTHGYDKPGEAFVREKIIFNAKKIFEEKVKEFSVPRSLFSRINAFIDGNPKKNWYFNGKPYQLSWNSKEVIDWCKTNPYSHPLNFEKFATQAIYPFKQSIEIKAPQLDGLIKEKARKVLAEKYRDFTIYYKDIDKPSFYADVDKLLTGISGIFEAIKEQFYLNKKNNEIKISFEKKVRGLRILKIIHLNSECKKKLDIEMLKGSLLETKKYFHQTCDWIIQAKNPGNFNTLNIWSDSVETPRLENKEIEIEGFTHIIKIYSF